MDYQSPGFRFYPREEELISFYLLNKLEGRWPEIDQVIPVVDIYDHDPSDLPQLAGERCRGDTEQWFFFIPMQDREARGGRPNRLTNEGYWKATGSLSYVYSSENRIIGMRRSMVFYQGRAPNGRKTPWKMNEYKAAIEPQPSTSIPLKLRQELSLCRVYKGSKSVRAFDRRPPPAAAGVLHHEVQATAAGSSQPDDQQLQPTTSNDHQNRSSQADQIASSLISSPTSSSSSSSEEEGPSQAMGSGSYNDLEFDQPMWDWEQFNWF